MKFSPRYLVAVNLVLLASLAYFGAATVSSSVAARLTPPVEVRISPAPPPLQQEDKRPASYYQAIQGRDIFNAKAPPAAEAAPPPPPKPTELRLKLWGIAIREADNSYCIIEDLTTRRQELYKVNATVAGVATVKRVEWDKVILDRDGAEEILLLEDPTAVAARTAPSGLRQGMRGEDVAAADAGDMPNRNRPRVPGVPAAGGDLKVEQTGDGEYTIDRAEVDSALDNMSQLFTQVRAVPHFQGGKSTGFRLFAIRQGSLFDKIGLRNGDIIQSVNGNDISDPSRAMGLFQELRNESHITAKIIRNKEERDLSYTLR